MHTFLNVHSPSLMHCLHMQPVPCGRQFLVQVVIQVLRTGRVLPTKHGQVGGGGGT